MGKTTSKGRGKAPRGSRASHSNGAIDASTSKLTRSEVRDGTDPNNPVRIYADGIFDLFHFGHARALEQAKKLYPHVYLLVGVCNDVDTNKYKGKTVMTESERYESLRHCKWVDEVITDAPWIINEAFLQKHNIDYVAHDAIPYVDTTGSSEDDVYGPVKRMGKFKETKRTEGVSTSDLILRIIKDYNEYVLRNLSRGYSREDLGLSLLKEKRIRATRAMRELSARMKQQRTEVADRIKQRITLPTEVGKNVQGFATSLESLVEKLMNGEIGNDLMDNMDKLVTGFISSFERNYQKLEKVIKTTLERNLVQSMIVQTPKRKRNGGGGDGEEGAVESKRRREAKVVGNGIAMKTRSKA